MWTIRSFHKYLHAKAVVLKTHTQPVEQSLKASVSHDVMSFSYLRSLFKVVSLFFSVL